MDRRTERPYETTFTLTTRRLSTDTPRVDEIRPITGLEEPPPRALPHLPRRRAGRLFGLVLVVGSTALMGAALWQVLHIGTCASGGPYVSARPCPHGTALWIAAFPVGMLAWFAGMAFVGGLILPWAVLFTGLGATFVAAGLSGDLGPGGTSSAWSVGPLFLLMGLVPGIWALVTWLRERDEPPAPAGGWMPPVAGAWVGDASATSRRDPG